MINLERDVAESKSEYALVPEFIGFLIVAANFRRCGGLGFRSVDRVSATGEGERCIILLEAVFVAGETVSPFLFSEFLVLAKWRDVSFYWPNG